MISCQGELKISHNYHILCDTTTILLLLIATINYAGGRKFSSSWNSTSNANFTEPLSRSIITIWNSPVIPDYIKNIRSFHCGYCFPKAILYWNARISQNQIQKVDVVLKTTISNNKSEHTTSDECVRIMIQYQIFYYFCNNNNLKTSKTQSDTSQKGNFIMRSMRV